MPIVSIQRRMRELGRIRTGHQVDDPKRPGKRRPEKLATFRLTSATRDYVEAAADVYGGEVSAWDSPRGAEWGVVIASTTLDVIVPPGEVVDPWYELWAAGGCTRRCDGHTEILSGSPCLCPADPKERQAAAQDGRACKPTTRLSVALPALPDLGVWRLESHGFYAAVELAGVVDVMRQATEAGVLVRARLRLDHRQVKRPNEPRKDFYVPVLELPELRLDHLLPDGAVVAAPRQIAAGERPALPPGPALPERSDFRPPSAAPSATADDIVAEPGTDSATGDSAAPGASVAVAERIRDLAGRSGLAGEPTDPQKRRLVEAFEGLEAAVIQAGVAAVFDHPRLASSAEADAVIKVADELGEESFRTEWAAIAAAAT